MPTKALNPDDAEFIAAIQVQPATGQFSQADLALILPALERDVEQSWVYLEQLRDLLLVAARQYGIRTRYLCLLHVDSPNTLHLALAEAKSLEQAARNNLAASPPREGAPSRAWSKPLKKSKASELLGFAGCHFYRKPKAKLKRMKAVWEECADDKQAIKIDLSTMDAGTRAKFLAYDDD